MQKKCNDGTGIKREKTTKDLKMELRYWTVERGLKFVKKKSEKKKRSKREVKIWVTTIRTEREDEKEGREIAGEVMHDYAHVMIISPAP